MHGKVPLIGLELALALLLESSVSHFAQLIQFNEELTQHLFLDGFLVGTVALDLVPQLDFEGLAECLLHRLRVSHVQLDEVAFANVKTLHLEFLEQNVQRIQTVFLVGTNELGLEHLAHDAVLQVEPLNGILYSLDQMESVLENKFHKVKPKDV